MKTKKRILAHEIRCSIRSIREYRKLEAAREKGWFPSIRDPQTFTKALATFHFNLAEQLLAYRAV